ncbi:hydroxymethylglutaryl-CoA synthase [Helcococcus kunzii]
MVKVGIEKINLYIPEYYIDIKKLAEKRLVDPNKYLVGIGQEKMSVIPSSQDIISMASNAAINMIDDEDRKLIDQVIFATESGIDFSKSAATVVHDILKINSFASSFEIKQACYSTTAAIKIAVNYIKQNPGRKVLVLSSDISKYGANTPGEVTQGADAIAMLISENCEILEINSKFIFATKNAYDFLRPNDCKYPIVDGKLSIKLYIELFNLCFESFIDKYQNFDEISSVIFHLPFSKMRDKALQSLDDKYIDFKTKHLSEITSKILCKNIGNTYTGSLYLSLLSLLYYGNINEHEKIALFSYGFGAVGELFTVNLSTDYKEKIKKLEIDKRLNSRKEVSIEDYESKYFDNMLKLKDNSRVKLSKIIDSKRYYKIDK